MTDSKADLLLASVCHAGTEQSRWSKAEELRFDQNQCRRLKDSYVVDHPRCWEAGGLSRAILLIILPDGGGGDESTSTQILDTHL